MLLSLRIYKILMCGVIAASLTVQAEIYKWRDERGAVHYSDVPPSTAQMVDKLGVGKSDWPLTRSDAFKKEDESSKNISTIKSPDVAAEKKLQANEAAKQMEARLKAQNCANARTNYRNFSVGGRIQSVNENGEKAYMNDDEIREGLARAQQEIDANCTQ